MSFNFNYFIDTDVFIEGNESLRYIQRYAHQRLVEEFKTNPKSHKMVILPTGTGKTGVIALAPYKISNGRVLVITPNLIIRQGISDDFDTRTISNFWTYRKVILDDEKLPSVFRYAGYNNTVDKKRVLRYLNEANIVIANIHKVYNQNSEKPLASILDPDFFDMIIIDEAHHSAADSWQKTLEYFNAEKVIKLTATPYRGDQKDLEGDVVAEYDLADAIRDGIVKNLVAEDYTNEKIEFVIDNVPVGLQDALDAMDRGWITRSVAFSEKCSRTIVEMSIKRLKEKRELGNAHHQILAVACGIDHAEQIKKLYEEFGLSAEYVTSDRPDDSENAIIAFKKGDVDVLVNVNMLGEGFDHPNISIAAIFRPFRTLAPYAQFIGRSLRKIQGEGVIDQIDNVAHVIYHKELDLDDLWEYYIGQKETAERRKSIETEYEIDSEDISRSRDVGEVIIDGKIISSTKTFLSDGIAVKYSSAIKRSIEEMEASINDLISKMKAAGISDNDIADFEKIKRQKLDRHITEKRNELRAELIREELHHYHVNDIIKQMEALFSNTGTDPKGNELPSNSTSPIYNKLPTNEAYVRVYVNLSLKNNLKRGIDEWETYDFEKARVLIPQLMEIIREKIERHGGSNEK